MRSAVYARVSTSDQEPENQLQKLRRYAEARGWTTREYIDNRREERRTVARLWTAWLQTRGGGDSTFWSSGG